MEEHGREGEATLAEIRVGELDCYFDGYPYRLSGDAGELLDELSRRESLRESLGLQKSGEDRFLQRVDHWKESALRFLPEIYTLRGAVYSINQRYFKGLEVLFPAEAEGFVQLLALVEKMASNYNQDLADSIERVEKLLGEKKDGHQPSRLTIDLAELIESAQGAAKKRVSYLLDMAKADALDVLGETRQAMESVDRHV